MTGFRNKFSTSKISTFCECFFVQHGVPTAELPTMGVGT
jgi:hypothetical protein